MSLNSNLSRKTQPIVAFLNLKTPNYLKQRSQRFHLLASTLSPHLEKSKLSLNLVDDASPLDIIPWKLSVPVVHFDNQFQKRYNKPRNSSIYNLFQNTLIRIFFSLTVLKQRTELLRWLYQLNELINLLPVGFQTTVQYIQQSWELFY